MLITSKINPRDYRRGINGLQPKIPSLQQKWIFEMGSDKNLPAINSKQGATKRAALSNPCLLLIAGRKLNFFEYSIQFAKYCEKEGD